MQYEKLLKNRVDQYSTVQAADDNIRRDTQVLSREVRSIAFYSRRHERKSESRILCNGSNWPKAMEKLCKVSAS